MHNRFNCPLTWLTATGTRYTIAKHVYVPDFRVVFLLFYLTHSRTLSLSSYHLNFHFHLVLNRWRYGDIREVNIIIQSIDSFESFTLGSLVHCFHVFDLFCSPVDNNTLYFVHWLHRSKQKKDELTQESVAPNTKKNNTQVTRMSIEIVLFGL